MDSRDEKESEDERVRGMETVRGKEGEAQGNGKGDILLGKDETLVKKKRVGVAGYEYGCLIPRR